MQQTKLESLIEVVINTVIGFTVTFVGWPIAAWITGSHYTVGQQAGMVAFFTVLSVLRGYVVRRFFNAGLHRTTVEIAARLQRKNDGLDTGRSRY